jgi:NAD dependent epimerase/dehydratase
MDQSAEHSPATGNPLAGRSILVTGAGGFIGSHLVEALVAAGARVRAFVRYTSRGDRGWLDALDGELRGELQVVRGDLRDAESLARAMPGVQVVFHLAAQVAIPYSYMSPRDFVETNVGGTLNVALAARDAGVERVVHTSTSEVYGSARVVPITESHPLEPQSPYAATKVAADKLMEAFQCSYELPVTVLRPFNTYGPRQSARAIVPTVIAQALAGETIALGSLEPRRDLTYVSDTVGGFLAAAAVEAASGQTIQLGTGYEVSVGEIVDLVGELVGRSLVVTHDPDRVRPTSSEVDRLISAPDRARELLGWVPRVELREGLERTLRWVAANRERFRADQYAI